MWTFLLQFGAAHVVHHCHFVDWTVGKRAGMTANVVVEVVEVHHQ